MKATLPFNELNIPHGNLYWKVSINLSLRENCPNAEFFPVCISCIQSEYRKIRTRKNAVFGNLSRNVFSTFPSTILQCVVKQTHGNNFGISFLVTMILILPREADLSLLLVTNTKYIVCLLFSEPQTKCMSWLSIGNIFYFHVAIFEILNQSF